MNDDEFIGFLKEANDLLSEHKRWHGVKARILLHTEHVLLDCGFKFYPLARCKFNQVYPSLQPVCNTLAEKAVDIIHVLKFVFETNRPSPYMDFMHEVISKEEARIELKKRLLNIPNELQNDFKGVFWESFYEENEQARFVIHVHKQVKKVITEFCMNELLDFESRHLLALDFQLYDEVACAFTDEFMEIVQPKYGAGLDPCSAPIF